MQSYLKKQEKHQIDILILALNNWQKKNKKKKKLVGGKKIIKIRAEISEKWKKQ